MLIDTSAPVVNLLQRAEEGIARADWKLVIDSLQRVIDDPEGALVAAAASPVSDTARVANGAGDDGMLYESARRQATRVIASLPPEGLRAYRLFYDGQAKRLFDRARAEHDPAALRLIASRYLITQYGDDASELLASWALDEGRPGEALALLTDVLELVPDRDVPEQLVVGKLAAAYAMLGQNDQSSAIVAAYQGRVDDPATGPTPLSVGPRNISTPDWLIRMSDGGCRMWDVGWRMSDDGCAADREHLRHPTSLIPHPSSYRPAPPLTPSLVEAAPWFYELPGTTADLWRRIYDDDPAAALVLPSSQFVSDGTRLFVRISAGRSQSGSGADASAGEAVTALDLQDLMVSWESSQRRQGRSVRAILDRRAGRGAPGQRNFPGVASAAAQPQAERVEDYIGGAISIAHGLVFTVERGGAGGGLDAQNAPAAFPPNFAPAGRRSTGGNPMATRLVAYDARSGELRWQRGAGGDPDDELIDVQFRAAAIAVGDHVWAPYFKQSDLFIAVLNPTDGSLVRSVLLGSAREPLNPVAPTLLLAVSDGLVYVPSGYGALFALDAADATVRWACQYERGNRPRRDPRTAPVTAWLPSPPVVAGGLVLLAATDHRELLAFSAGSGEFRWSAAVEHGSYVIAADSTRVWLGGRNISCLSVADGKPVWATRLIAVPTGRGVVSGELVFVPTSEGLLSLDAATGAAIGVQPTPPSQTPLGDLLCVGTALFSVDPSSVRKFPDLERTHAAALARRETLPTDPSAAMQLAWVELLRGEPGRADEVLQQISTAALAKDPHRMDSFARVRVETAIALAGKAASGSAEALQWLQVADAVALTGADRLRCRLAIADQHIAGGRYAEAYGNLVQLGLSAEADQMVPVYGGESVETTARTQIVERLRELHAKLNTEQTSRLDDEINRQLSEASSAFGPPVGGQDGREVRKARAKLQALAYLPTVGSVARRALLELADWERRQLRFERAEQFLLEGARNRFDPSAVAAFLGLCELYGRSAQDQISALMPCLAELEKRFGSEPIPQEYSAPPAPAAAQSRPLVAEWVAQVRSAIPSAVRDAFLSSPNGKGADPVERRELSNDAVWAYHAAEGSYLGRIVRVEPEGSPLLRDRILLYRSDGVLECLSAGSEGLADRLIRRPADSADGELLWQTRLRLPEEFAESTLVTPGAPGPLEPARRAVTDGQIVVLNGADGLFAVGLVTGRRLWMRPHDTPPWRVGDMYKRDQSMAAADGLLAATPRQGRLTLMRMIDGSTVWERDLRGEPVDAIWMSADRPAGADRVITADAARQRVHLFDRADGRLVKRILFQQADPSQPIFRLVSRRAGTGMIVGPESSGATRGVVAVGDALGDVVWRVELDKPPVQLFQPKEGYVGIGLGQGMVRIVDADNGETVLERQVSGAYDVTGGVLFDGLLVLRVDAIRGQKQSEPAGRSAQLTALDVATGEEVWRREDISSLPDSDPGAPGLRIEDGVIPALVETMQAEVTPSGVATPRMRTALVLIDARTGRNLGLGADLTSTGMGGRFTGDVVMRPGAVIVGTQRTVNAYRAKTAERDGTGKSH
jgi:outer membrane protein assembly factor BamB